MTKFGRALATASLVAGSFVTTLIMVTPPSGVKVGPAAITVKVELIDRAIPTYTDALPPMTGRQTAASEPVSPYAKASRF
jgi:hypothetical protein